MVVGVAMGVAVGVAVRVAVRVVVGVAVGVRVWRLLAQFVLMRTGACHPHHVSPNTHFTCIMNPIFSHGMTGQSSILGRCVTMKLYHSTSPVSSRLRSPDVQNSRPSPTLRSGWVEEGGDK